MRLVFVMLLISGLSACSETTGTTRLITSETSDNSSQPDRMCENVMAVAVGFGEDNVTGFANNSLDRKIDMMKDSLVLKGAKGFQIEDRRVACEDYIDFGGSIGQEHLCRARANVCGQVPS